ncbi:hypothetical protein ACLB2K_020902 [Fragaria x ananassa]
MAGDDESKSPKIVKGSETSKAATIWENSNHPLFLHHSDQPGAMLVSEPLAEDNYSTWAPSMMIALRIKNKTRFVDGTLKRPTTNAEERLQWDRCNTLVKTWLISAMSKNMSKSVIHCKEARDKATAMPESVAFSVEGLGRETSLTEKEAVDTSINSI